MGVDAGIGLRLEPGVETLTVTGATPGSELRVDDTDGRAVVTVVADASGNAHVAFVPAEAYSQTPGPDAGKALASEAGGPPIP